MCNSTVLYVDRYMTLDPIYPLLSKVDAWVEGGWGVGRDITSN